MKSSFIELYVNQGTDFEYTLTVSDDQTNANVNVSSYTFASQMRRSYYSSNATANLSCVITDGANGQVTISLDRGVTSNVRAGRYLFDVIANNGTTVERILEGIITVTPSVTR